MEVSVAFSCPHCLKPVNQRGLFCCSGCQIAYEIINQCGFGEFYTKRGAQPLRSVIPESTSSEFNDIQYVEQFVVKLRSGDYRLSLYLQNITCSACAWLVERAPFLEPKILSSRYNYGSQTATIIVRSLEDVATAAQFFSKMGYPPKLLGSQGRDKIQRDEIRKWYLKCGVGLASALATMHVTLNLYAGLFSDMPISLMQKMGLLSFALSLPALTYSATPFYRGCRTALLSKRINIDALVTFSIVIGVSLSLINLVVGRNEFYFDSVTMLVSLLLFGRLAARISENRLSISSEQLVLESLGAQHYGVGSSVTIKPGETIPVDGIILEGNSDISTSWTSGEQESRLVSKGGAVLAGSLNLTRSLTISCQRAGSETQFGQMLLDFEKLQNDTPVRLEELEDRFSKILISVWFLFLIYQVVTGNFNPNQLVALILVTCPCSFALASPMAASQAWIQAFRKGIWLRNPWVFFKALNLSALVFDKTGTLTESLPQLKSADWFEDTNDHRVALSGLLGSSKHPVVKAISQIYRSSSSSLSVQHEVGSGVWMSQNGSVYRLGRASFATPHARTPSRPGLTDVWFSQDHKPLAVFWIQHPMRQEAKTIVSRLKKSFQVFLLSGDRKEQVEKTAEELGISPENLNFEQSPQDKLQFIESLRRKSEKVMTIGDGVNDTLALKRSEISCLIGGGFKTALEGADIFIPDGRLQSVEDFLIASQRLKRTIYYNYLWAIFYNLVGVGLVLMGILGPVSCAIIMPVSSLFVILVATNKNYFSEVQK